MGTLMDYSRAIRVTTSGVAYNGPTRVCAVTGRVGTTDATILLRDGGATGAIMWEFEVDSADSSPSHTFNPPIRFYNNVYVEIQCQDTNVVVCLAVVEN
jgi:hypothetical protein